MASANQALQDRAIQHALTISRYGAGVATDIVRLLNSADKDIVAKIAARIATIEERGYDIGPATTRRLRDMLEEVRALNSAIYARLHDKLMDELSDFSAVEAEFQRDALVTSIGADLGTKLPSPEMLRAIVTQAPMEGRLLADWTEGMEQGRIDRINQAVRLGMVQGESTDKIVARIRGTRAAAYSDGVLDISRKSAQSTVLTAVNHASNVAAQATWKANSHLIKGWQFLATLDGRVTKTCAGLSGQVFPIGEGPIPPRHVRCRSISVAVTKSLREIGVDADEAPAGTRASMDGQIAGDTKFADWLTSKGDEMQNKILGPTRAQLFRDGKLDLQQFIKSDGTVLTLEELKKKYPNILR